jgi:predicted nucleotidyltransferase component of viral defense system
VRKRSLTDLAASVHQRLLNLARETGRPFNDLLQRFAMERFLYRLSASDYADRFVLKGALMLAVWHLSQLRPTLDIDLLGHTSNDVEEMARLVRGVCRQEVEADGMRFDAGSVVGARIVEEAEYQGVRLRFRGSLGNAVVAMQIDVGFGDVVVPAAALVEYPTLLDFPAPRLRGYSRESLIAEKLHAMTGRGLLTSRMKDFFDVWMLSRSFDFDGATLAEAIRAAFARRGTPLAGDPEVLGAAFAQDQTKRAQWQAFRRRVGAPEGLRHVVLDLSRFLGPVVTELAAGRPFRGTWRAPGPWLER